ncbi:Ino4p [Kluyveromyces lactis]|uniref:KLLA0F24509p n=1 Tax=Kluyveromyces lactis (strain ATCC 8585 / CBS 2359 / DSM 70799 / NBRC 1267 / NRRL Y-1140 / WM37) TaxID=284590 RepID=B5FV90_KLULA|nr:uncharacterized protein KLLA0_F24509g [Kluyveromyces lactis]CAR64404.1 KLLA0F24509p [Kluyveromyces lactis]|eukprot:XP_002999438.1 uncharacterized protein KLLA0_F24509g [Kluyveromyces lactis]
MATSPSTTTGKDIKKKSERRSGPRFDPAEQRWKHVSCEKNRRSSIRGSYDKLVDLVPGLSEKERRSEWKIYVKSRHYLLWLYARNKHLRQKLNELNREYPAHLFLERHDSGCERNS